MKLVMTLLVRNEADIVEANIEYHLAQGVDFVIATDHGSEDGTSEVLREYERMGVAKVIRDEGEGHHQSERVTRMVEVARLGQGADWVINNDADEFWWPLVGNLRDVFTAIPERYGQVEVERRNFRPHEGGGGPFHERLIHREVYSLNMVGHTLERKVAHRPHPQVVVEPGNHSIRGAELAKFPMGELLEIFHFPTRGFDQFERKVLQIGHGYEQLPDRSPLVGRDQLALLETQRAGGLRDYYDGLLLDDESLKRGLRRGTIVVDRRLDDFMRDLRRGEVTPTRPDAPFAGRLLDHTTRGLERVELTDAELAAVRADLEREGARVAQLEAQLEAARVELQRTSQALDLLRSSRLMRSTGWARGLYYRARRRH